MTFSTRDLLFTTALAAAYSAMTAAGLFGSLAELLGSLPFGLAVLVVAVLIGATALRRIPDNAGALLYTLDRRMNWFLHGWMAVLVLVLALVFNAGADVGDASEGSLALFMSAYLYIQSWLQRATLHEHGLVLGGHLFDFQTHQLTLRTTTRNEVELVIDQGWRRWLDPSNGGLLVPAESAGKVRAFLALKQPPEPACLTGESAR
ncbi:MAG: hypothetical protein AAF266_14060 [Planctomycetota bacterium]